MSLTIHTLRITEWVLLGLFVVLVAGTGYVWVVDVLPIEQKWGMVGLAGLVLTMQIALQTTIDKKFALLSAQANFTSTNALHALYERSPVAYLTLNANGSIIDCNTAALNLLKLQKDTTQQRNFYSFIADEEQEKFSAAVLKEKIGAGVSLIDNEIALYDNLGNLIWVSMTVYDGQTDRERMISLMDVTQQKMVDTAKSEFVALATHQLRTPIAAIRWNVELLEKKTAPTMTEDQSRYFEKINRNVDRMIMLINDFLNVSKLEMGTFAASAEQLRLDAFMLSIQDEFLEKINAKELRFEYTVTPPAIVVNTDPRLFHIIVSNLVSNAVKYAHTSGAVTVVLSLTDQVLTLQVSDTGIGVPENELSKLFSKFFRASNAQSKQTQGTGLGLYVIKKSIEKLGGTISVDSVEGQGTTFTALIPVQVVSI